GEREGGVDDGVDLLGALPHLQQEDPSGVVLLERRGRDLGARGDADEDQLPGELARREPLEQAHGGARRGGRRRLLAVRRGGGAGVGGGRAPAVAARGRGVLLRGGAGGESGRGGEGEQVTTSHPVSVPCAQRARRTGSPGPALAVSCPP